LVLPSIPAVAGHDPIYPAIDLHKAAAQAADVGLVQFLATPTPSAADRARMEAALSARDAASRFLVATAPTTRLGVQALADYTRDENRQFFIGTYINRTITLEDGSEFTTWGGDDAIEKLIARRTAEIG
jgi:hypothetical protein